MQGRSMPLSFPFFSEDLQAKLICMGSIQNHTEGGSSLRLQKMLPLSISPREWGEMSTKRELTVGVIGGPRERGADCSGKTKGYKVVYPLKGRNS